MLSVKDVDSWVGDFTVDEKAEAGLGHLLENGIHLFNISNPTIGVRRCTCWVKFARINKSRIRGIDDILWSRIISKIECH